MCGRATSTIRTINHTDFRTLDRLDQLDRFDRLDSGVGEFTIFGVHHTCLYQHHHRRLQLTALLQTRKKAHDGTRAGAARLTADGAL